MESRNASDNTRHQRTVRSFVRREGRITPAQERALATLMPRFGVELTDDPVDWDAEFGREAPRFLEIGFGNGEVLAELAECHPERDFVGAEVHRPGIGRLLIEIERRGLDNVRIVAGDATGLLRTGMPNGSLAGVNIFFPDPWPKKRHHKRRLIQASFVELLAAKLAAGGHLHIATDWQNYAEHIVEVMAASSLFDNPAGGVELAGACVARPETRPETKFERRGLRRGHGVWDLVYVRRETSALDGI